jgi:long-chain alkane monooxygenase
MSPRFHLGWFLPFQTPAWDEDDAGTDGADWFDGSFHIDLAKKLDRAGFDYMMLEDSSKVPDVYGGSTEIALAYGNFAPKHDPVLLVPLLAAATEHLGIIATMSTSFYPPFILARTMATLDHLTHGRVGWNMVTSSGDAAAKNFGLDQHYEHDHRYEMAEEFAEVVLKLWDSWDEGALVMDREKHVYVDASKVHAINHEGRFYKVAGPLNTLRPVQGRPVLCQAGASPKGREFAAKYADTIICPASGVEAMKAYRDDIRSRMERLGRNPDDCKVMFVTEPVVGATTQEAIAKRDARYDLADHEIHWLLSHVSGHVENDLSQWDWDAPLPELTTNAHRGTLEMLYGMGNTIREVAVGFATKYVTPEFVGTPDEVAAAMGAAIEEIGGDGFLINSYPLRRSYIDDITDTLVPALQARGLTRSSYSSDHLRDNLLAY